MEKVKLTENNLDKKQPSNLEAEQALLGSILVNNDIIDEISNFITEEEASFIPSENLVVICTGSQGEKRSALYRIAYNSHRNIHLEKNDVVIFSSRDIPGNEKTINALKNKYKCDVGYSGHEFGLTTTIASICMGATIIERHITLDRTMWGTDQMCSVEPQGLIKLVRGIKELSLAIGDGKKRVTEKEKEIRKKLRK